MLAAYENDPEAFAKGDNYLFVEAKSLAFDVEQNLEELTQNIFEGNEERSQIPKQDTYFKKPM